MIRSRLLRSLTGLMALAVASCASWTVADTTPLPASKLEPPGSLQISSGGYRVRQPPPSTAAPDLIVLVAISGGGKRSSSFGYGALMGMRDTMVPTRVGPRPLLDFVAAMSGVSGGSFPVAYYGLQRDAAFGKFETDFLYSDTNSYIYGIYLLPWHWRWLAEPDVGTNDYMERIYDRTMFHGATYNDLQAKGPPIIAVGATDLSYGSPFLFNQEYFDLICSDLSSLPISRAVAASNGFPGLFSPVTLTNRAQDCGGRQPAWVRAITPAEEADPLSRQAADKRLVMRYLDTNRTKYVHLVDGGVSDNLALRAAGSLLEASNVDTVRARGFDHSRRLLVLSIDGQGAQDPKIAQEKDVGGLLSLIGQVSGSQIDAYNFETLITVTGQLKEFRSTVIKARCRKGPVFDGARCDDVQAELIHLSLASLPDGPEKARLLAIPTGLTLKREDVDLLIRAGHDSITGSAKLRAFLDSYPVAPLASPAAPPRSAARTSSPNG